MHAVWKAWTSTRSRPRASTDATGKRRWRGGEGHERALPRRPAPPLPPRGDGDDRLCAREPCARFRARARSSRSSERSAPAGERDPALLHGNRRARARVPVPPRVEPLARRRAHGRAPSGLHGAGSAGALLRARGGPADRSLHPGVGGRRRRALADGGSALPAARARARAGRARPLPLPPPLPRERLGVAAPRRASQRAAPLLAERHPLPRARPVPADQLRVAPARADGRRSGGPRTLLRGPRRLRAGAALQRRHADAALDRLALELAGRAPLAPLDALARGEPQLRRGAERVGSRVPELLPPDLGVRGPGRDRGAAAFPAELPRPAARAVQMVDVRRRAIRSSSGGWLRNSRRKPVTSPPEMPKAWSAPGSGAPGPAARRSSAAIIFSRPARRAPPASARNSR